MNLEPLPKYGDLFTLAEFQKMVDSRFFTDYDGYGCYATESQMSSEDTVRPSMAGQPPDWATHVVWFNR